MTGLLELKERLIRFFGKNEIYVVPVLKFILATVVFLLINQNIGYMTRLAGLPVTLYWHCYVRFFRSTLSCCLRSF